MTEHVSNNRVTMWPVAVTLGMLVWSIALSPYTEYGDDWAVYPLLLAIMVVLICHIFLIVRPGLVGRMSNVVYAFVHIAISIVVLLWSLMTVSKDAL